MRVKIKDGAFISHDFGYFNWPNCRPPKEIKANIDYEFDAEWTGRYWDCKRPGYGIINDCNDAYGNGSIFVFNKEDVIEIK